MDNHRKFSILIPAYNEEHPIVSCLHSLISLNYDNREIIVIDDASTDHTVAVVKTFTNKGIVLVQREKNGGRAAALNSGLQNATGDIIVTTDADTVVPPDWLHRFESYFKDPHVVAVGGSYQARNMDKPLPRATSILDQILNGLFKKSVIPNKLSGVNSAIRRDALVQMGGFNEHAWWSEDSELGWKLDKVGQVVYDPDNMVSTIYPDTWSGIWRRKFYWGYAMGLQFKQCIPANKKLLLRPALFFILFVSLIMFLVTLPYGFPLYGIPGIIFFFILNLLTILYIPLGVIIMIKNKDRHFFKTAPLLAILPIIREFAYVYGMGMGFYKGKMTKIRPSWKKETR
ncbi:MAG: glycosyltransferase family 2 protein [Candidatus Brocadiaceae bacterium]